MGAAIAQRLLGLGHEVTVWNRTAEKTGPLAAAGAKVAATPSRLASASETVITILTDAAAIAAAYHSKDGLLSSDVSGRLFVEMSTVRPETTRPLGLDAARLVDIFTDTSGGPNVLKNRGPALAAAIQGKAPGPITVDIDAMRKDLRTMVEEAEALGTELPVTSRALECYDQASRAGPGKGDITAIPVRWMKLREESGSKR